MLVECKEDFWSSHLPVHTDTHTHTQTHTHRHTHTEIQLAPWLEVLPPTNKNSPPSLPLNLNDFFQLLCRNRKSLWELEQCLLNWTPSNSATTLHTPWTGQCKNAQVCWRQSVSSRSEHPVCPGAYEKGKVKLCCAKKSPLCAPPWTIPDSRGVRGRTGVLVWFVLNKILRLCLLLLFPSPHSHHTKSHK